jgi:hypothetical protein
MRVRHFARARFRDFCAHQDFFGFNRALYALELQSRHLYWGRFWWVARAVAAKRLYYLLGCAARYPTSLISMLLSLPILLIGVSAWCVGFRRGCRERTSREKSGLNIDVEAVSVEPPTTGP